MSEWRTVYEEAAEAPFFLLNEVAYGDGLWVATRENLDGVRNLLYATDPDGPWTSTAFSPNPPAGVYGLAYGDGNWLITGLDSYGYLYTTADPTGSWTANTDIQDAGRTFYLNGRWVITAMVGGYGKTYTATDPTGAWSEIANGDDIMAYAGDWADSSDHSFYYLNGQWVVMFQNDYPLDPKSCIMTASTIDGAWALEWESDADDLRGGGRLFYDQVSSKYHLFFNNKVYESSALDGSWTEVVDFPTDYSTTSNVDRMDAGLGLFFASGDSGQILTAEDITGPYEGEEIDSGAAAASVAVVVGGDEALAWDSTRLWLRSEGGEGWGLLL